MATRHPMTTRSRINEREHPMLTRSLSRKHPQPKPQRRRRRNQVKRGVNKPFVSPLAEMSCLDLCWLGMSQTHVEPVLLERTDSVFSIPSARYDEEVKLEELVYAHRKPFRFKCSQTHVEPVLLPRTDSILSIATPRYDEEVKLEELVYAHRKPFRFKYLT